MTGDEPVLTVGTSLVAACATSIAVQEAAGSSVVQIHPLHIYHHLFIMTNKTVVLFGIPSQNKVLINEAGCVAIPSVCFALSPALAAALLPAHCWALLTVKLREFLRAKGN